MTLKKATKVTSDKVTKSVGAPTTMAELLAATKHKIIPHKRGDVVKGRVAAVVGRTMFVDVGGKTEGIFGRSRNLIWPENIWNLSKSGMKSQE